MCSGVHRLLIARRKSTKSVLHTIAKLAEHHVWNVERVLTDEINTHAFRSNQSHQLFDLLLQRRRDVGKKQMRLIEEENKLRFVRIAYFRQTLK